MIEKLLKTQSPRTFVFAMGIGGRQLIVLAKAKASAHGTDRMENVPWARSSYSVVCF